LNQQNQPNKIHSNSLQSGHIRSCLHCPNNLNIGPLLNNIYNYLHVIHPSIRKGNTNLNCSSEFVVVLLLQVSFNLLKTERRLLYLKTQFVPCCKHFSTRL
jgi:hypothetical protein